MPHLIDKLEVYIRSLELASQIVSMSDEIRPFRLAEQMAASAVSIASNISEGAERTPKEFIRFLDYARGSAAELHTQLQIAIQSNRYDLEVLKERAAEALQIKIMLHSFQLTLKHRLDRSTANKAI